MSVFKYKNVVISGLPGTGESTLMDFLKSELTGQGWTTFSGGGFMRQYAIENGFFDPKNKGHHSALVYGEDFDRKVDFGMRQWLEEKEKMIIESWLAGFVAQGVSNVLKILLVCKKSLRIDRIVNRDELSVNEVKENIEEREEKNVQKWIKMYQKEWQEWIVNRGIMKKDESIDFWDNRLYDLVIDTYRFSKRETFEIALQVLKEGVKQKYYVSEEWEKEHRK